MKSMKKILFSVLAIALFLVGPKVEAKTVSWDDLVAKLKEGRVVEEITNAKNNGENQDISITANASKFTAVMTIDGEESTFELNYSDGKVTYNNDFTVNSDSSANFARLHDKFIADTVLFAGELYSYASLEVADLLSTGDFNTLTLANDGIEMKYVDYTYATGNINFEGERITIFKLDLVNGFAGLQEVVECQPGEEGTISSTPAIPEPTPNTPTEETKEPSEQPKVEEEKLPNNPSTGDVQLYYIVGGIVVCMVIAISAAIHLKNKEEII